MSETEPSYPGVSRTNGSLVDESVSWFDLVERARLLGEGKFS